ncbi:hypothetical protein [Candidatus Uabimicrobium sp. HlEnr_7]|uniref:hypothetical protein n=1 Tax=Candidatus Uabimicrobium helgolandensis TaxID=3095367 RepID=UPI0035576F7A
MIYIFATPMILVVLVSISDRFSITDRLDDMKYYIFDTKSKWKMLQRFTVKTKFTIFSIITCSIIIYYTNYLGSVSLYFEYIYPMATCTLAGIYIIYDRKLAPDWKLLRIFVFAIIGLVIFTVLHFACGLNLPLILLSAVIIINCIGRSKNFKQEIMELIAFPIYAVVISLFCENLNYKSYYYTRGYFDIERYVDNYMYIHPVILYSLFVVFLMEKLYFPVNAVLSRVLSYTFFFLGTCFIASGLYFKISYFSIVFIACIFFIFDLFTHSKPNSQGESVCPKNAPNITKRQRQKVTSDLPSPKICTSLNKHLDRQISNAAKFLDKENIAAWKHIRGVLFLSIQVYQNEKDSSYLRYTFEMLGRTKRTKTISKKLQEYQLDIADFFITHLDLLNEALQVKQLKILYEFLSKCQPHQERWMKYADLLQKVTEKLPVKEGWRRSAKIEIVSQHRVINQIVDYPPQSLPRPLSLRFPLFNQNHIDLLSSKISHCNYWIKAENHFLYYCEDERVEISLVDSGLITKNNNCYRYEAVWGSKNITYDLVITLPQLATLCDTEITTYAGEKPHIQITEDIQLKITSTQAWFAKITIDYLL